MSNEQLIGRLRHFAEAYPTDIWPPMTPEERKQVGDSIVSRISADMGRHCAKIMAEAALALEEAEQSDRVRKKLSKAAELTAEDSDRLIERQAALLTQTVNILRGHPEEHSLHSHHDIPQLASVLMKHHYRNGVFLKLVESTLFMLADSARMMLEEMDRDDKKTGTTRDEEDAKDTSAKGPLHFDGVQKTESHSPQGSGVLDPLLQGRADRAVDSPIGERSAAEDDVHGG
jgi:hypothetical protein